jgi:hypothetical protein
MTTRTQIHTLVTIVKDGQNIYAQGSTSPPNLSHIAQWLARHANQVPQQIVRMTHRTLIQCSVTVVSPGQSTFAVDFLSAMTLRRPVRQLARCAHRLAHQLAMMGADHQKWTLRVLV